MRRQRREEKEKMSEGLPCFLVMIEDRIGILYR